MGVIDRDPKSTAATLARWLGEVAGVHDPQVSEVTIPGSTGWSNETILFDAEWGEGDDRRKHELVARIAPSGYQVFPEDTFARQQVVMRALAERTSLPMAAIHWSDEDPSWFGRPFWLMDRIAGDIATDSPAYAGQGWLHDASPAQQEAVWNAGIDAIAAVHRVDVAALGLPEGTFPDKADDLAWHLGHWEDFLTWGEEGEPHPMARRALGILRRERPDDPAEGPTLVWGDSRFSNLIYRDFEVVAVLDWEMAGLGDPLLDLGWWVFSDWALTEGSGCVRLPGFPSAADTAQRWSVRTGRSAAALDYYELFAGFRFTVIMLRMGRLLADLGWMPPEFARDNLISQALEKLLDRW